MLESQDNPLWGTAGEERRQAEQVVPVQATLTFLEGMASLGGTVELGGLGATGMVGSLAYRVRHIKAT